MASKKVRVRSEEAEEFITLFKQLCASRNSWQVWPDLISVFACSISNQMDELPEHFEAREKEYEDCINKLGSIESTAKLFSIVVMALRRNPDRDFLGELFMGLGLSSNWKGQFFTPYNVSKMTAKMMIGNSLGEFRVCKVLSFSFWCDSSLILLFCVEFTVWCVIFSTTP